MAGGWWWHSAKANPTWSQPRNASFGKKEVGMLMYRIHAERVAQNDKDKNKPNSSNGRSALAKAALTEIRPERAPPG